MIQQDKKAFVEQAIETSCLAFFDEWWFSFQEGEMGQEYYPELSCKKTPPEVETNPHNEGIQGTMCFIDMTGGIANLYLACNYYNEIGEDYFVFWDCRDEDIHKHRWLIWLPIADRGAFGL